MIFKQSNLIIALSIGLQLQSGNASAFDLSDVTNAVDQVNSVAKQLNVPQPIPTTPTPTASTITEVPKEFQGKWVTNQSNCVGNPDEVIGLDISESYIEIGPAWGEQIKATKWVEQGTTIEITGDSNGEDQVARNNDKQKLTLSDSGNSLSMTFSSGKIEKYSRCGGASASTVTTAPVSNLSSNKKVLFSCTTKKGKTISLTKSGNIIQYSFGLPNKPELVIDTPEDKVKKDVNSRDSFGISFTQDKLSYYVSYQKYKDDTEERGVIVDSGKKHSEIFCDNSKSHFEEGLLEFITGDKYESEYKVIY